MKNRKRFSIFFALLCAGWIADLAIAAQPGHAPQLFFRSGFEQGVFIDKALVEDWEDYRFIRGTDRETGFSWPIAIRGATHSALHYIADDDHRAVRSSLQTVIGPHGVPTKALYQEEKYSHQGDTQCPYEILDITQGRKDLYIKYWIKIDRASLSKKQSDSWRTFFEYKTKDYATGDGFRLISFIYTDEKGTPYWHWQGDANPENPIWEIDNKSVPVPLNEWFLTEFYWHWSEGGDGRALWKINGHVIGDHRGPTTRHAKPLDFIMLCQIYGNANPKHQWIDDIEIWDGLPE